MRSGVAGRPRSPSSTTMLVSMSTPTSEAIARALSSPPSSRAVARSETSHRRSESISVPSMSHRTAAGRNGVGSAGIEVLGLRVVGHERVRRLLGMQLQLLGELDADAAGLEQAYEPLPAGEG